MPLPLQCLLLLPSGEVRAVESVVQEFHTKKHLLLLTLGVMETQILQHCTKVSNLSPVTPAEAPHLLVI